MEAFACIRVKIVSTGWMARVEIPPEIQPAVKSIQDDSLDMLVVDMLCFLLSLSWLLLLNWYNIKKDVVRFSKVTKKSLEAFSGFLLFCSFSVGWMASPLISSFFWSALSPYLAFTQCQRKTDKEPIYDLRRAYLRAAEDPCH